MATAISCSDEASLATAIPLPEGINVQKNILSGHTLTITNRSSYKFMFYAIGAQPTYDLNDNLSISHKNNPAFVINPGQTITYYDYSKTNNNDFNIYSWSVIDLAIKSGFIGDFNSDRIALQYGILTQPNNPNSERFPVWTWIQGGVLDQFGQYLEVLEGNNPLASSMLYLGNQGRGYNSILKYGRNNVVYSAETAPTNVQIPYVIIRWKQAGNDAISSGAINISIENVPIR